MTAALNLPDISSSNPNTTTTLPEPPSPDEVIKHLDTLVRSSSNLNTDPALIQIRAAALFARLKALNRAANAATRVHKHATSEARSVMDHTHLGLQNLQYEKRHLEREIEKCRQFASIYQDIPIHSLEEFFELAPEETRTDEVRTNEHQLMLNRLSFELSERQRLEQRRKELTSQKDDLLKQSKAKTTTLDNVKGQVDLLMKTASDIQKKVDEMVKSIPPEAT